MFFVFDGPNHFAAGASRKFCEGQNILPFSGNSVWFGTPPLEAQNDKVCQKVCGHGPFGIPLATRMGGRLVATEGHSGDMAPKFCCAQKNLF